ncbi:hypothetical protein JOQ06_001190 [Pogonophryne albipinna]|uniref:alanine transaminase n=1 Tax=Pogonophryne albipinna TaxID=1090488 RepID=A0AAD6B2B6_9TELE|nr:hypothetical protein JOQ06_001190 [Pogonophryne albipinna]
MKKLDSTVLARRANQIKEELRQKLRKPYKQVIDLYWGNPHAAGVKPLSFVRQVLAACLYPDLVKSNTLPVDVRQRAQSLLGECAGGSVGSYTDTAGIPEIVHRISEFITKRDGGAPSDPENIYISPGSQWSLRNILKVLVNSQASPRTGVLTPWPCYPITNFTIKELGGVTVPYYLSEEQGWELQVEELHRALDSAKGLCNPVTLYVINPGNPAGYVQSRKTMQEVIRFASEKRLSLLADEVYQECVHGEKSEFLSYKRVLSEMGPPLSDTVELASFHSASKGFMGECGLRGGYVELVNLDPDVMKCIYKLFSTDSCAPVLSQIALDLMTNPPQPGDPSYPLYSEETQHIKTMMVHNVKRVFEVLNSLPGFSCQPVEGGGFAFPRLHLPPKAIQKAKVIYLIEPRNGNGTRFVLLYETPGGSWCVSPTWHGERTKGGHPPHQEISLNLKNMKKLDSTVLARRANQIKEELRQKLRKPYKQVIDLYWGDPHAAGVKPLSFVRQVLAACLYPDLVNNNTLPVDVRQRAQRLLGECAGGSVGSYTATAGIPEIVHRISEFITKRDGGAPSDPENIYISPGSQWSLRNILKVLVNSQASPRTGVLTPWPCYPLTNFTIKGLGGVTVPYYLSEEQGWELQVEELHRALDSAKGLCNPVALYVINPGNPAGYVQSRKTMQEVIRFASEKRLSLLADEVLKHCHLTREFIKSDRNV